MATSYITYINNDIINAEDIAHDNIFTGNKYPRHKLKYIHTWGYHVYVLDPTLQQGHKVPKWTPRSYSRIFVGFSPNCSSDVPLFLNPDTGHISPQFYVTFDDSFVTFISLYPK